MTSKREGSEKIDYKTTDEITLIVLFIFLKDAFQYNNKRKKKKKNIIKNIAQPYIMIKKLLLLHLINSK